MKAVSIIFPGIENLKCCMGDCPVCVCGDEEKVIRNYLSKDINEPMTEQQRDWCISTAVYSGQGLFSKEELSSKTDYDLACAVMQGWREYAASM